METEITIREAAAAVYRKYGTNLAAFWRDAFAAEAQKHGDPVEQHGLDGNCIHYVPICHRCRLVTIDIHLKDKEQICKEERKAAFKEAVRLIGDLLPTSAGAGNFKELAIKTLSASLTEK